MDFIDHSFTEEIEQEGCIAYIGISNDPDEEAPTVCVEFPISLRIFCIAFALSRLESNIKE
ncbi:MAG: hypothetical protein PHO15_01640 [Eubacteriales bacterium]|nr:hypothetical protein [Eubacteriales bacterium]